jgi:lantibiotic modifying enzyme
VVAKVARMDEVDRHDQEWLITATLATRPRPVTHRGGEPVTGPVSPISPDPDRLLSAACGIADEIVARAARGPGRANWIGLELLDGEHWALAPMGAGLAEGYTGVALFLAQLGTLTGAARYTDLARRALDPVPALLDVLAADPELAAAIGPGAYSGLGGICYALARTARLLDDPEIADWLRTAVGVTATAVTYAAVQEARGVECADLTVSTGLAGGLAALLAVQADSGLGAAGDLASACAGHLVATTGRLAESPRALPSGFARGWAGIGWALLRAATVDPTTGAAVDPTTGAAGWQALTFDRGLGADPATHGVGWCGGVAGTVLAHTMHLDQPAHLHHTAPDDVDASVDALADQPLHRDMSLCHGELGAVEALTVLASRGHERARTAQLRRAGLILSAIERSGARCGTPDQVSSPGLLTGLAGIGHGLLRLGFAADVPSILLLNAAASIPLPTQSRRAHPGAPIPPPIHHAPSSPNRRERT